MQVPDPTSRPPADHLFAHQRHISPNKYPGIAIAEPNLADKTIWTGDNLDILRGLNSESVDLIYLDPPFNSNRDYAASVGSRAAGAAFKDTWTLSDLDTAYMGIIADERPAMYKALEIAGLTHGKSMQSYLCMIDGRPPPRNASRPQADRQHLPPLRPCRVPLPQAAHGRHIWSVQLSERNHMATRQRKGIIVQRLSTK